MEIPVIDGYFGRYEICTPVSEITRANLCDELNRALALHAVNSTQIDYLWRYMRGEQPILTREKTVRPEICNKIVENHAAEITEFTSGYFMGEPVTYVRRGDRNGSSKEIETLNDYMFSEDKASHDKNMATWMAVCGVGYRMILPDREVDEDDECPFEIDTPDPRYTFVVYHSGFGHKRMMGVRQIFRKRADGSVEYVCCGYTHTHYFEVKDGVILKWEPHSLEDIPIFEYNLNMSRMGSFEPAIPLLDGINTVMSNRIDDVEQFVQSLMKFINCDIDDADIPKIRQMGAVKIKSLNGQDCDVQILSQELNQQQTQTLVDYMYEQALVICGMPTTTKGGASTSDTGTAVFLRDGWSQCEARARDTELLFKKSEKQFLKLALSIIRGVKDIGLKLCEVECKFTRRQHDNLATKTQALGAMLAAGLHPEVSIATSGLFNDPMDVFEQSKKYLAKWEPAEKTESVSVIGTEDGMAVEAEETVTEPENEKTEDNGDNGETR